MVSGFTRANHALPDGQSRFLDALQDTEMVRQFAGFNSYRAVADDAPTPESPPARMATDMGSTAVDNMG